MASTDDAPLVAVKNRYGTPARSQNSCARRDFPTWRRPLMASATPVPFRATLSRRARISASSVLLPTKVTIC